MGAMLTRFLHLSDVHFGAVDHRALAGVESYVRDHSPTAIIVAGDITQSGRRHEFIDARAWFDSLGVPWIAAPGNHDTPALHLPLQIPARAFAPFRRYDRYIGERSAVGKLVEYGDGRVRISALNTARGVQGRINWADGVISLSDLDAALDLLGGGPANAWRVLVCHHPLREPSHSEISVDTRRGGEALRRCISANVDIVMTGHIHDAFAHSIHTRKGQLVQMGSGTLSTRVRSNPPGFCVVTLGEDYIQQEAVHLTRDGPEMEVTFKSGISVR
jgi:3',5'-cyclic AMP phosphodiesterase CpdA